MMIKRRHREQAKVLRRRQDEEGAGCSDMEITTMELGASGGVDASTSESVDQQRSTTGVIPTEEDRQRAMVSRSR
jgi:hypothetical protein